MKSKNPKGTNKPYNKAALSRGTRKGAILSAAATIGLLSTSAGDQSDAPSAFVQAI